MLATIYKITHIESGRCYVGHTANKVGVRWKGHLGRLRRGKHHSPYLQRAWEKYGAQAFRFDIVEECDETQKLVREQFWIDALDSAFNFARVAGSRKGCPQPPHEIERLRQSMKGNQYGKGRVHTDAEKERRAASCRGLKRSSEVRAKMSAANRGKPRPGAQGKPKSEEHRAKLSLVNSKPRPHLAGIKRTPEVRARMSEAQRKRFQGGA